MKLNCGRNAWPTGKKVGGAIAHPTTLSMSTLKYGYMCYRLGILFLRGWLVHEQVSFPIYKVCVYFL